jgi:hypothetical protein
MKTTTFDVEKWQIGEPGGAPGTIMKPHWKRNFRVSGKNAKPRAIFDAMEFSKAGGGRWRVVKRTVQEEVIHTTP